MLRWQACKSSSRCRGFVAVHASGLSGGLFHVKHGHTAWIPVLLVKLGKNGKIERFPPPLLLYGAFEQIRTGFVRRVPGLWAGQGPEY